MNVTWPAPRDSASMPIAPDPAQTSAKCAPSIRGMRMLKSVSRSRSEVGRTLNPSSVFKRRPLYNPAITRIGQKTEDRKQETEVRSQSAYSRLYSVFCLLPSVFFTFHIHSDAPG